MGIDAEITCTDPDVTDEEIAAANEFIEARGWPLRWGFGDLDDEPVVVRRYDCVDFSCGGERYYGPGYERGYWPHIASGLMIARAALPNHTIGYGGDSTDPENHRPADGAFIARMWDYYLHSPDWNAYHRRAAEWNRRSREWRS